MKRLKRGTVENKNLISKSAYAKKIGISPAAVDKQVNKGYLTVFQFEGGEAIYLD